MRQEVQTDTATRALRGVSTANYIALAGFLVAFAFGTQSAGPRWTLWPLLGVLVPTAVLADILVQRRRAGRFTLGVATADATLVTSALGVGVLVASGGWLILAGAAAVGLVQLSWFARARALGGHWDGPFMLAGLLGTLAYVSAQRPWSPSSSGWLAVTMISASAAALSAWATMQTLRRPAHNTATG